MPFYFTNRHFLLRNRRPSCASCRPSLVYEPFQFLALVAKGHGWTYLRAVAGLMAMLPALPRDRAFIHRIRRRPDSALLDSAPIVVGDALAGNVVVRTVRMALERVLASMPIDGSAKNDIARCCIEIVDRQHPASGKQSNHPVSAPRHMSTGSRTAMMNLMEVFAPLNVVEALGHAGKVGPPVDIRSVVPGSRHEDLKGRVVFQP